MSDGLIGVFQKLLTSWYFAAQPPLKFTDNGAKKRERDFPVSGALLGEKGLVEKNGQTASRDDRKATVTQMTTRHNHGMQKSTPGTSPVR